MNGYYFLAALAAFLNTIANMFIKTGASKIGNLPHNFHEALIFFFKLATNWFLVGGLAIFGCGFLIWVIVLNKVQLSAAAPIMSLGYVFIMILSYFLFKEPITFTKISGVIVILLGVVIITR
jgi:drug/metabolite transporter (DMT)-like permease